MRLGGGMAPWPPPLNPPLNFVYRMLFKGIGTPVEKIIQSVDLFFPVQLIVLLIVYQHVNYFFDIPLSIHAAR